MIGAAGVGMAVGEQQRPAVRRRVGGDGVDGLAAARVEGEMVQAGAQPVVFGAGERRGLLDDDVRARQAPASAVLPVLELLVAESAEQPAPFRHGAREVGHPQFDVVEGAGFRLGHEERYIAPGTARSRSRVQSASNFLGRNEDRDA